LPFCAAHRFFWASEILFLAAADIFRFRLGVALLAPAGLPRRRAGPNDPTNAAPSPATDLMAAFSWLTTAFRRASSSESSATRLSRENVRFRFANRNPPM
jgi:hypothetical protein